MKTGIVTIFKILAHGKRLTILSLLKDRCRTPGELSKMMKVPKSEIQKHLDRLEEAGLVKRIGMRDGEVLYDLSSVKVYKLLETGTMLLKKKVFENISGEKIVDVRGEICPVPLIETEKVFKELEEGKVFEVWTDYPLSKERIVSMYMNFIVNVENKGSFWRIVIRKGALPKNSE